MHFFLPPTDPSYGDRSSIGSVFPAVGTTKSTPGKSNTECTYSIGNKDDENDDDKIDIQYNPERLMAFNMFVQLLVDERLDRIVPLCLQPKEAIEGIVDACTRQFSEFVGRTRKLIENYLKSCQESKQTRDASSCEVLTSPPHLTSILSEQILATAYGNEVGKAIQIKRGLYPISESTQLITATPMPQYQIGSVFPAVGTTKSTPGKSNTECTYSIGNKDDENDDDKIDIQCNPERLTAFNMFVQLLVDERLDRIVPLCLQPKEAIEGIIDACTRQFSEFVGRTRKMIENYLKSCQESKQTRDASSCEVLSSPPHLTSILSEQILATAYGNEVGTAVRIKRGLCPISTSTQLITATPMPQYYIRNSVISSPILEPTATPRSDSVGTSAQGEIPDRSVASGSNSVYQTALPAGFQNNTNADYLQQVLSLIQASSMTMSDMGISESAGVVDSGPTDQSRKGGAPSKSQTDPTLSAMEIIAIRQLITGFRESASFLLRSADELETKLKRQFP